MCYLHGVVDTLIHVFRPVGVALATVEYREDAAVEVQLAGGARLAADCQDGTARSVGGHQHRRAAGRRRGHDRRRHAVDGRLDGSQGRRVGNVGRSWSQDAQLLEQLLVVDGRLRLTGDLVHRFHRLIHTQHVRARTITPTTHVGTKPLGVEAEAQSWGKQRRRYHRHFYFPQNSGNFVLQLRILTCSNAFWHIFIARQHTDARY